MMWSSTLARFRTRLGLVVGVAAFWLARPTLETRSHHSRPDPNPTRLLAAFAGLASASALVTAMLPSILPIGPSEVASVAAGTLDSPSLVTHVTRYVILGPGQSAPPNAPVVVQPSPTPQAAVVTRTRQSGKP